MNTAIFENLRLALPGLESKGGEEAVGDDGEGDDATFEDGYDGVLRVETVEWRFSCGGTVEKLSFEIDSCIKSGLRFFPGEPLGE